MADYDLRKLKRAELLEMLIDVTAENERLMQKIEALNRALAQRELDISNMGSIAEASLQLSNVFEEAQRAADQYLENVRIREAQSRELLRETQEACEKMEQETREKCEKMEQEAREKCEYLAQDSVGFDETDPYGVDNAVEKDLEDRDLDWKPQRPSGIARLLGRRKSM